MKTDIARRKFMGTLAAALGYAGIGPLQLSGQGRGRLASVAAKGGPDPKKPEDYDKLIKLANNENIRVTKLNARDVGVVYICNPNNPTGRIVPKDEIKLLLDSIPGDIPVFIDEAYHHFVDDPNYEPSVKYVIEGRKVIIARTFSKIAALAGMRLGYAVAPKEIIDQLRPFVMAYNTNVIVKFGGVASLKDTANEARIKQLNKQIRDRVTNELKAMGYEVIPSQSNFFMVNVKKDVTPVAEGFLKKGFVVGRKFPPMTEWLRVSVGTDEEMKGFMKAFKEVFPAQPTAETKAG